MNIDDIVKVDPMMGDVQCDGGRGSLGHPVVYYTFDGRDEIICKYCSKVFTKKAIKSNKKSRKKKA
jgi:uncharacterized Zn-finger protein